MLSRNLIESRPDFAKHKNPPRSKLGVLATFPPPKLQACLNPGSFHPVSTGATPEKMQRQTAVHSLKLHL